MRANWLAVGAMVIAAACGGGDKPADTAATGTPGAGAPATGTVHDVQMTMVGINNFVNDRQNVSSGFTRSCLRTGDHIFVL